MVAGVVRVGLTILLVLLAVACAAGVAYGTDPRLIGRGGDLGWIMTGRRWQWLLAAGSMAACVGLIGLVIAGRRRVWWLIALAPVMGLFYQRFMAEPWRRVGVVEGPIFVPVGKVDFLKEDEAVVGLVFEGTAYAYPCGALARTPVVIHADGDRRVIVMESAAAGRATAATVDHSVKAREMDVVSMPAGATLVLNSRVGQFVNAFTGHTPDGKRPGGFGSSIDTTRTTWVRWRARHPDTLVMAAACGPWIPPPVAWPAVEGGWAIAPEVRVILITGRAGLSAIVDEQVKAGDIINLSAGGSSVLLVRDGAGALRAYDRTVKEDLFPRFARKTSTKFPSAALADPETGSLWTIDGKCIDGPAKGEQLKPIHVEPGVVWGTLKVFYSKVELLSAKAVDDGRAGTLADASEPKPKPKPGKGTRPR